MKLLNGFLTYIKSAPNVPKTLLLFCFVSVKDLEARPFDYNLPGLDYDNFCYIHFYKFNHASNESLNKCQFKEYNIVLLNDVNLVKQCL